MKKRYRKMQKKANGKIREMRAGGVLLELPLPVVGVMESIPEVIRELSQEAGLLLMSAAMQLKESHEEGQLGGAAISALSTMTGRRC